MIKFLMILLVVLGTTTLRAQTPAQEIPLPTTTAPEGQITAGQLLAMSANDYIDMHLPPLHVLLQNARERCSQVNMFAAKRDGEERELKTIRRSWLRYLKLNSTFSYGTNDASSQIIYENSPNPYVTNVTGTTQRWWNVGASFNLPLDEIFNRRNRIKQQERRIEGIQYEVESWYDEIALEIIDRYTTAVEYLSLLEMAAGNMVTARAQYISSEADFVNGKIDAQTLSRQKSVENDSVLEYERARGQLNKALLQLEILSKTNIISKPEQGVEAN